MFDFLKLPEAGSIKDLDSPETARVHRNIILSKEFLKRLYADHYRDLDKRIPVGHRQCVVEIGSGCGFIKDIIPGVITSDVFHAPWIDRVFSAEKIPFEDGGVDAFILLDVFHHLPDTAGSLREMSRCLRPGGKIIMIEPANTLWSRFILKNFHHEDFDTCAGWGAAGAGRLSAGNMALPWIVFVRDRAVFQKDFPELSVSTIDLQSPFLYILSGGLSYKAFLPSWMFPVIKGFEFLISPLNRWLAFFQTIELEKK